MRRIVSAGNERDRLCIVLLSNWGHADRIGLTGLQCFPSMSTKVDDDPLALEVINASCCNHDRDTLGTLVNLINGKVKVITIKYNWFDLCLKLLNRQIEKETCGVVILSNRSLFAWPFKLLRVLFTVQ